MRAGVELALVSLLAVQAARLVWILAEPAMALPPSPSTEARIGDAELASLTRFNPFAPRGGRLSAAPGADPAMNLYGVRMGGRDGGSAIIAVAGGAQGVFGIGEEVQPGMVLKAVGPDSVELAQGGRIVKLQLASAAGAQGASGIPSYLAAPVRPAAPAKPSPVAIDPKKFLEETGLRPHTENGKLTGYTVLPRGGAETLRKAGLEAGDVLVGVNGGGISPERYSELERELASSAEVQLTVRRGAETKTITLQTGR